MHTTSQLTKNSFTGLQINMLCMAGVYYIHVCIQSEHLYSCNCPTPEFLYLKHLDCQHALSRGTTICHYHVSTPWLILSF